MNWSLLIPLLVTTIVATLGWIVAHRLQLARDRATRQQDLRTEFLVEAYQGIVDFAGRQPPFDRGRLDAIERAIADIQLFGNQKQVASLEEMFSEKHQNGDGDLNRIINELRAELREELGLEPLQGSVTWLRFDEGVKKSV